ncbi:hypothetical protein M2132_000817 [Dysgonomonas sp. PH5-45]|uniref:hypothetical protein n=1 Tax=unclassified Dysgonomonas TaxID=2630389 RepID=UPI002474F60A|nr:MULTISPECIES: hypothetical protein [unclassified Dysgonomonas]MDH6354489.1 hypothetical protein [Dysgonomonas sp. PH5-45]MDH6387454.1 hypothetical protein [Dysgonomonas sp. PH5-37]
MADETLLSRATQIKEETEAGANTAERVGGVLEDIIKDSSWSTKSFDSFSDFIASLDTIAEYTTTEGKKNWSVDITGRVSTYQVMTWRAQPNRTVQVVFGDLLVKEDGTIDLTATAARGTIIWRWGAIVGGNATYEKWKTLADYNVDTLSELNNKADKLNGDNVPVVYHDLVNPVFEGFIDTPIQKVGADGTFEGIYYSTASRCFGARINNDGNVVYTNVIPGDDVTFTYYNTKDVFGTDCPFPNKVYSCDDRLYLWNGTDLAEAFNSARFERRIAFVTELTENILPIGEAMTIYKATGKNLLKLEVKPNDSSTNWTNIPLDADTSIDLSAMLPTDALLRVTRATVDSVATVYLFTRVNQ